LNREKDLLEKKSLSHKNTIHKSKTSRTLVVSNKKKLLKCCTSKAKNILWLFVVFELTTYNQVDGYFLCGEKYLTLPSDWNHVQLIDLIAQQTVKSFFSEIKLKDVGGFLAKFTT